jgi:hypothetical protein
MKLKIILSVLFFGASNCYAGLFRVESETYSSARKDDAFNFELPIYENLSTSYLSANKDFEFNSNFSVLADPTQNIHSAANLYILDVKFQAIPDFMEIKMGRSLQSSLASGSLDMLAANFFVLNRQIQFGPLVAVERRLEVPTADLLGAHFDFYTNEALPYFLSTKLIQRKYRNALNNTDQNSGDRGAIQLTDSKENLVEFSVKKTFNANWSPEFIFDSQTNLTNKNLDRLETGFDLYPTILTYAKIRALTYDVLPNSGSEQPIYSIFSVGRLYELRLQYQKKLNSDLISGITFFGDNYQLQENRRTSGYGAEWELKFLGDSGFIDNNIYTFSSYGGKVFGNRILVQSNLKNELYALFDIANYEKITSSKRNAINTEIGFSYYLGKQYKLTLGGELNSNNILLYDLRAFAKLTFMLWNDT